MGYGKEEIRIRTAPMRFFITSGSNFKRKQQYKETTIEAD
jgi:hypothetical protein